MYVNHTISITRKRLLWKTTLGCKLPCKSKIFYKISLSALLILYLYLISLMQSVILRIHSSSCDIKREKKFSKCSKVPKDH